MAYEQPRRGKITEPVTKDTAPDLQAEFTKLKARVDFMWRMMHFLELYPAYKIGDYLIEHRAEVEALSLEPVS